MYWDILHIPSHFIHCSIYCTNDTVFVVLQLSEQNGEWMDKEIFKHGKYYIVMR